MIDHLRHPKPADSRAHRARRWLRFLSRSEDGQAVVELALVLPILLVVVLGIVDFGRAANYWNDENNLANQAARYATVGTITSGSPCAASSGVTQLVAYIKCEAALDSPELSGGSGTGTGVQNGGVSVCVNAHGDTAGAPVTVTVSALYNWLPLPKVLGGNTQIAPLTLTGSATMRVEQSAQTGNNGLDIVTGSTGSC